MARSTQPGQVIGGRYRLVADLGSGGFGRVWKAHDETLGIDVAVKEVWLPPALSETEQAERLARAEREARNAARLRDHPHIVAVHDVVVDGQLPWIVMRLVDGCSLAEHLAEQGRMTPKDTERIATALLRALGAAHETGIVHRDIKPANVLLTTSGEALLTDFGIAVHQTDTTLTTTGALIGSVEYMAPERARGTDGLAASDLFSLGVTLYEAVENLSPFHRGTPTGCLSAVLFDEAPPAEHAGRLAPLITALLNKDPDRRPDIPEALALLKTPTAPQTAQTVRNLPVTRRLPETRSQPEPETISQAKAAPRPNASPRPTTAGKAVGSTPGGARRETTPPKNSGTAKNAGAMLFLVVLLGIAILAYNWPLGDSADKKACDKAFQDIATFQDTYPSYGSEESTDDSAAQAAADRLSAELRTQKGKANDVNVSITLGNYALVTSEQNAGSTRTVYYGSLRSACKDVGSTP